MPGEEPDPGSYFDRGEGCHDARGCNGARAERQERDRAEIRRLAEPRLDPRAAARIGHKERRPAAFDEDSLRPQAVGTVPDESTMTLLPVGMRRWRSMMS